MLEGNLIAVVLYITRFNVIESASEIRNEPQSRQFFFQIIFKFLI